MTKSTGNTITLSITVRGEKHELRFVPTLADYNKYLNDISMSDKVVPSTKYLKRVAHTDDKEALDALLQVPGVVLTLAGELNEEYAGDVEAEVKK